MNFLRKTPEILAFIGFFLLMGTVGTVGTMDVRPEYPLNELIVQAVVAILMMFPLMLKERWWKDEN